MGEEKRGMLGDWPKVIVQGVLVFVLCALIPGAFLAYLEHIGSIWAKPLLVGMGAALMVSLCVFCVIGIGRLPAKREITTLKNVELHVRKWLDNFRVTVRNEPCKGLHFRVLAVMDSGTKMIVGRSLEDFTDYIFIRSDIVPSQEEINFMRSFPPHEQNLVILEMRQAIARFKVGTSGIGGNLEPFHVFKRVPINDRLDEDAFISALDEIEAALHTITNAYLVALNKNVSQAVQPTTIHQALEPPQQEASRPPE